jgi:hypothetical protein
MGPRQSSLLQLKSSSGRMKSLRPIFRTGELIPESGIYRVVHAGHRLPHEVTLLRDEYFPKCAKCHDAVAFELVRGVALAEDLEHQQIRLYELPVLDEDRAIAI